MNATKTLAQFIVDTSYDSLPSSVVEAAKIAILDGVANMVAGSTQDLATIIGQYVKESGGNNQAWWDGDSRPMLPPPLSPTECLDTVWTTRYKGTHRPTEPHLVCPRR